MLTLPLLQFLTLVVFLGVSVFWDLRERRIPNKVTVSGLLAGLVLGSLLDGGLPLNALSGAALALVVAFSIHAFGGFGAGDAKLLTAVGAFVGPGGLLAVFVYGALFGGLLALVNSARRGAILGLLANTKNLVTYGITGGRAGHRTDISTGGGNPLPYGIPIAAGALLAWAFPLSLTVLTQVL